MDTYDTMPVKPKAGDIVRISYESIWACWDSVHRPITRGTGDEDYSRYLAPKDASIEIIDPPLELKTADIRIEYFQAPGQSIIQGPLGVKVTHIATQASVCVCAESNRLENMAAAIKGLIAIVGATE